MKRLAYTLLLLVATLQANAQSENSAHLENTGVKDFGGFILDMSAMLNAEHLTVDMLLPPLSMLSTFGEANPYIVNPDAFRINPAVTYMGGTYTTPSHISILSSPYGNIGSGMVNWQGASYKLNNGMRINLYGEYDADGHKVYNPSAMPWQRNNFNAAFEMKSEDGSFGIKLEVHRGRNNPY